MGDGQESGIYWAFDIATGNIVWNTLIGPGTSLGGLEWGSAYDGQRIYTAEADPFGIPYTTPGGQSVSGGSWAALDAQSGRIDWQTATPGGNPALGPVSEAGGLLYGASMDPNPSDPDMFALDTRTGKILWSFAAGSSVNDGPSIVDGTGVLRHRLQPPRTGPAIHRKQQALRLQPQRTLNEPPGCLCQLRVRGIRSPAGGLRCAVSALVGTGSPS
ncbi:MAG: outer membrane protein assembly factor BamB family protein [Solirubrobacteraceae bacterium]